MLIGLCTLLFYLGQILNHVGHVVKGGANQSNGNNKFCVLTSSLVIDGFVKWEMHLLPMLWGKVERPRWVSFVSVLAVPPLLKI